MSAQEFVLFLVRDRVTGRDGGDDLYVGGTGVISEGTIVGAEVDRWQIGWTADVGDDDTGEDADGEGSEGTGDFGDEGVANEGVGEGLKAGCVITGTAGG